MTAAVNDIENVARQDIPEVFIAEYLDGIPMYYKGYKTILNTPSQIEEIMGAGAIHSILVSYFVTLLAKKLDDTKYWLMTGETGLRAEKKNLFNLDLAIYLLEKLPADAIGYEYVKVAPELAIEIDTQVQNDDITEDEYVFKKTQRLLDFGTGKVIWVFSKTKRVMVAEPNNPWQIVEWNNTLELVDGIEFSVDAYCREKKLVHLL